MNGREQPIDRLKGGLLRGRCLILVKWWNFVFFCRLFSSALAKISSKQISICSNSGKWNKIVVLFFQRIFLMFLNVFGSHFLGCFQCDFYFFLSKNRWFYFLVLRVSFSFLWIVKCLHVFSYMASDICTCFFFVLPLYFFNSIKNKYLIKNFSWKAFTRYALTQ